MKTFFKTLLLKNVCFFINYDSPAAMRLFLLTPETLKDDRNQTSKARRHTEYLSSTIWLHCHLSAAWTNFVWQFVTMMADKGSYDQSTPSRTLFMSLRAYSRPFSLQSPTTRQLYAQHLDAPRRCAYKLILSSFFPKKTWLIVQHIDSALGGRDACAEKYGVFRDIFLSEMSRCSSVTVVTKVLDKLLFSGKFSEGNWQRWAAVAQSL
jgi:hypothetical protein